MADINSIMLQASELQPGISRQTIVAYRHCDFLSGHCPADIITVRRADAVIAADKNTVDPHARHAGALEIEIDHRGD